MSLVTVKDKFQVVIPPEIRRKLGISRGDLLEAKIERGRLTYVPKNTIGQLPAGRRERERLFKQLRDDAPAWIKDTWAHSRQHGTYKLTISEINAEIAAARRKRASKSPRLPE